MGDDIMKIKITAAGDMLVQRRVPAGYEGFDEVRAHIERGDGRFVNLETTIHNGEYYANQFCGGSYLRADPGVLDDLKAFGFNITSFANNHALDFDRGGLMATKKYIDEAGLVNTGAGANLHEASAPAYLDTKGGRVALVSATTTFGYDAMMAGVQSRRFIGRPGVNALRIDSYISVTPEEFKVISEISDKSQINAQKDIERREGYFPFLPAGTAALGALQFKEGTETKYCTSPNKEDMQRICDSIKEATRRSDCVIVSIHSHEIAGDKKENPADFLVEFAHGCIDAGAHAVIGHGPHLLRPVEIYKGAPIFYSLGDFIIHNECVEYAPEDMYAMQKMTSDDLMTDFFEKRSAGGTRGLMRDRRMLEAVIPYMEFEDGVLSHLEFMPIELNFGDKIHRSGNPRFSTSHGIIERLAKMCEPYGLTIEIDERGYGVAKL